MFVVLHDQAARCVDTEGSFTCECRDPHQIAMPPSTGASCIDKQLAWFEEKEEPVIQFILNLVFFLFFLSFFLSSCFGAAVARAGAC